MKSMKWNCLMLLGFLLALKANAQDAEPVLAKAYYQFIYVNDTTKRDHPKEEETVLYIGEHSSFYKSNAADAISKQVSEQIASLGFDGNITISSKGRASSDAYYFLPEQKLLKKTYQLAQEQYIIDEPYTDLDWKIMEDTLTIGGYHCQKAMVSFKGRVYTAWFTPELPFSFGPWKLQGLPGLILQAEDSKQEVSFHYKGFEKVEDLGEKMGALADFIKTDQASLDRLIAAYKKNPQAFMAAHKSGGPSLKASIIIRSPGGNATVMQTTDPNKIKSINIKTDAGGVSSVDNNPIELTK